LIGLAGYLQYASLEVKESQPMIQSFGFHYLRFKPDQVWCAGWFILVNLTLSLVVGLLPTNQDTFPALIIGIIALDFLFVSYKQPYLRPRYNKVRSVNQIIAILLFVNNLIYSSTQQFSERTASPAVIYICLNFGMIAFYSYHVYRILQFRRDEFNLQRLKRAGSGSIESREVSDPSKKRSIHAGSSASGVELADIKLHRKHTNIDPPSTQKNNHHGDYTPVSTTPDQSAHGVFEIETSKSQILQPLPVISEHDGSHNSGSVSPDADPNNQSKLVFTENPLADKNGTIYPSADPSPV